MSLDHDSGDLDGRVLDGRYEGRLLSQLALPALVELLQDYALADQQSASVLEAYLDRTRPEWRGAEEDPAPAGDGQTGDGPTGSGQRGAGHAGEGQGGEGPAGRPDELHLGEDRDQTCRYRKTTRQ